MPLTHSIIRLIKNLATATTVQTPIPHPDAAGPSRSQKAST